MYKGSIHWTDYLTIALGSILGVFLTLILFSRGAFGFYYSLGFVLFFSFPLIYRFISNLFKSYTIGEKGVIFRKGIFFQEEVVIKYAKINEIQLKQNFLQKLLGAGSLVLLTGNDKQTVLENLDQIGLFRDKIEDKIQNI